MGAGGKPVEFGFHTTRYPVNPAARRTHSDATGHDLPRQTFLWYVWTNPRSSTSRFRRDRLVCDEVGITERRVALRLLREGIKKGLVSDHLRIWMQTAAAEARGDGRQPWKVAEAAAGAARRERSLSVRGASRLPWRRGSRRRPDGRSGASLRSMPGHGRWKRCPVGRRQGGGGWRRRSNG